MIALAGMHMQQANHYDKENSMQQGNSSSKPVVVLGFGTAGVNAVLALREAGYTGRISVVTDEEPIPYSPVLISYYAGGRISRDQCFIWADKDLEHVVDDVFAHSKVVSVDAAAHEVALADGRRIEYSKLVVATGAHPIAPGFPTAAGFHPLFLRTLDDAERLRRALSSSDCKKALVSGTSMVGLKAVEACLDRNVHTTLLGRSNHIMRATAHPLIAERFEALLVERGVRLRLAQTALGVANSEPAGHTVSFSDGTEEHFDAIVLAQGVRPNLDFVGDGIEIGEGLIVDQFMRTSSPDVYAAGDVAQALDVSTGERRIIGLWQNAVQQGRCAGRAIADELASRAPARPYPGSLAANIVHVCDILFASVGTLAGGEGRQYAICETDGMLRMLAYEDNRLVGVNILATGHSEKSTGALDRELGAYRREVFNSYLQ